MLVIGCATARINYAIASVHLLSLDKAVAVVSACFIALTTITTTVREVAIDLHDASKSGHIYF